MSLQPKLKCEQHITAYHHSNTYIHTYIHTHTRTHGHKSASKLSKKHSQAHPNPLRCTLKPTQTHSGADEARVGARVARYLHYEHGRCERPAWRVEFGAGAPQPRAVAPDAPDTHALPTQREPGLGVIYVFMYVFMNIYIHACMYLCM